MSLQRKRELVGKLTKREVQQLVPEDTFSRFLTRMKWDGVLDAIDEQPIEVRECIRKGAVKKQTKRKACMASRRKGGTDRRERTQLSDETTTIQQERDEPLQDVEYRRFMRLPTEKQRKQCFAAFREATSNEALLQRVCVVCAREMWNYEGCTRTLLDLPNVQHNLHPNNTHPSHVLWEGMLIMSEFVQGEREEATGWVCNTCVRALQTDHRPKLSLANDMWIGPTPHELAILTFPEQMLVSRQYARCYVLKLYPRDKHLCNPAHLQNGIVGNATLYNMNTDMVTEMVEGQLLPQRAVQLASVIAITYVGTKKLPKTWLKTTFRVRRKVVFEALLWLKRNNAMYSDIVICEERLKMLPDDDVPGEITAVMRHENNEELITRESAGYVPSHTVPTETERGNDDAAEGLEIDENVDDAGSCVLLRLIYVFYREGTSPEQNGRQNATDVAGAVIPLQFLAVNDVDLNTLSMDERMKYALAKLQDKEGGYVVRHGNVPMTEFGFDKERTGESKRNPLAATFPTLFPYGVGGIEQNQNSGVHFDEHVKWALQYYDRRFCTHHTFPFVAFSIEQKRQALLSARVQMNRSDFVRDVDAMSSITVADLKNAEKEEDAHAPVSNVAVKLLKKHVFAACGRVNGSDKTRASYRGQIWGTCLRLSGPSLWITINPCDIHDPIVQIFAGEEINMDEFDVRLGPTSNQRAANVAKNPYAAAKYFFFIVETVLCCLFGIDVKGLHRHLQSNVGIFGVLNAYFGVVEAQGRGTLHVHMLLWLADAPDTASMHRLLKTTAFRERMVRFAKENVRAHVDGVDETSIQNMPKEGQLPYSRPPDPNDSDWKEQYEDRLRRAVRSQQVHRCTKTTCLRYDSHGRLSCKRRAPWPMWEEDVIDEDGNHRPRRTYRFINTFCPAVSAGLCCNNDIQLLTNGKDTKDIMWYSTAYQSKKQGKNFNVSALMANTLLYHEAHRTESMDVLNRNRLLIFRCQHAINREMELSGPQVISYLMKWGDCIRSHNYVSLYWSSLSNRIRRVFRELQDRRNDGSNSVWPDAQATQTDGHSAGQEQREDVVTIESAHNGVLFARSQVDDYAMRGDELEEYSFFSFVIDTYEEPIPAKEKTRRQNDVPVLGEVQSSARRGRPRQNRSLYRTQHPKHDSHWRVVRPDGHNVLPDIVGPFFPHADEDDEKQQTLYFACILALLRPWRELQDIKKGGETFASAHQNFLSNATPQDFTVMNGIQYYYECKKKADDVRGDDSETLWETRTNEHGEETVSGDNVIEENVEMEDVVPIEVTENVIQAFEESQKNVREEQHGTVAVEIAKTANIVKETSNGIHSWTTLADQNHVTKANGDNIAALRRWKTAMEEVVANLNRQDEEDAGQTTQMSVEGEATTSRLDAMEVDGADSVLSIDVGGVETVDQTVSRCEDHLQPAAVERLLPNQRTAYDIIDRHLTETIHGKNPKQLLMIIAGEGGVGKSKTIQTITENFHRRGLSRMLVKSAYTGIAAAIIDGKTLHVVTQLRLNNRERSRRGLKKLIDFWQNRQYLIIDEKSMLSSKFLAQISASLGKAKSLAGKVHSERAFGGVNVILVGDFHQFPPVMGRPLYWLPQQGKDDGETLLGRSLYEQFDVVVRLKEQVRVIDPEWLDLLHHVRNGNCRAHHISMLRSLIITNTHCPITDFTKGPWKDAVLITPRHSVRRSWNVAMAYERCRQNGRQMFICPAQDTISGRALTTNERLAMARKPRKGRRRTDEHGGLSNTCIMSIGMNVMVTFNVETDLDIANGSRGEIVNIVLDEREAECGREEAVVKLTYPPAYVLVKTNSQKLSSIPDLPDGVVPLLPAQRTFTIEVGRETKTVKRMQMPLTAAYTFTDYRSQGQTISHAIVDIATPPSGGLTPFNIYVALSRCRGRKNIRLLRDFDEKQLMQHPSEYLRLEDERLNMLERETKTKWETEQAM